MYFAPPCAYEFVKTEMVTNFYKEWLVSLAWLEIEIFRFQKSSDSSDCK